MSCVSWLDLLMYGKYVMEDAIAYPLNIASFLAISGFSTFCVSDLEHSCSRANLKFMICKLLSDLESTKAIEAAW